MIKSIVFDMGDVLMDFSPAAFAARYDLSEDDRKLLIETVFNGADWALCDWGYLTEEQVAERACAKLPERLHEAAWGAAAHWFEPVIPIEGMQDILRRIKAAGYGLYLLSNAGNHHKDYWPHVPGSEYFDGVLASSYVKVVKPQPEFYIMLFQRFSLKPDECLFIDNSNINLAGAALCGMHTLHFAGAEKLFADFKDLGINI